MMGLTVDSQGIQVPAVFCGHCRAMALSLCDDWIPCGRKMTETEGIYESKMSAVFFHLVK